MKASRIRVAALCFSVLLSLTLGSCAHDQHLVGITISPSSIKFLSPFSGPVQLTAIGSYVHPVETRDITNQVTWTTAIVALDTVTSTGLLSTSGQGGCGVDVVSATAPIDSANKKDIVIGQASVTVANRNDPVCPQ